MRANKISPAEQQILTAHVLKKTRAQILTHPDIKISTLNARKIATLIRRRIQGEPIAYLTGHKEFFGLDFVVNKNVLIPRPETETLVEEILRDKKIKSLADIGTGSGCIAISLAKKRPSLKIYATDISNAALKIAKKNAQKNKVKINFLLGDLLDPIKNKKIDTIVANLPYLDNKLRGLRIKSETRGLQFEPNQALYAGPKGLDCFIKFFQQIKKYRLKPKKILLEIGHDQAKHLKKLAKKYLPDYRLEIKNDLAGFNRVVVLTQINS